MADTNKTGGQQEHNRAQRSEDSGTTAPGRTSDNSGTGTPVAGPASVPPTEQEARDEAKTGDRVADETFGTAPALYAQAHGTFAGAPAGAEQDWKALAKEAEERDARAAVKRGAPMESMADYHSQVTWLMDNRADDRVVLHERDPLHPMGEVFFAAGVPRRAYLTPRVQHLLQTGELMPVPEPRRTVRVWDDDLQKEVEVPSPVYPVQDLPDPGLAWAAQPGRPVPLGRSFIDPAYFEGGALDEIRERQAGLPTYVPLEPGGMVPPEVAAENEEFMRGQRATGRRGGARR